MITASVIIPVYNAEKHLQELFDALANQTFTAFEIILVDDGSLDGSHKMCKKFSKTSKQKIRTLQQENQGPAAARNNGADASKGKIVVFLDSDCIPRKDWLSEMLAPFTDSEVAGVQGAYETSNKDSLVARYVGYEIAFRHKGMGGRDAVDWIGSFSAAYRRDVFTGVGGFDTFFSDANAEDPELSYRMQDMGHTLVFNPKAVVAHHHPDSLGKYLRQQFFRGFWRVPMYLKHKKKFMGDSYTGRGIMVQTILAGLAWLSAATLTPTLILTAFALLILSNIPFGLFAYNIEKKFLLLAPLTASLRSLAGFAGAVYGIIRFSPKIIRG